jgi:CheY-like chemotaxis protein
MDTHALHTVVAPAENHAELAVAIPSVLGITFPELCQVAEDANVTRQSMLAIRDRCQRERLNRRNLHMRPIVEHALEVLRSCAPSHIVIREDLDADCDSVIATHQLIHQIVISLCLSACSTMRTTGGRLSIVLCNRDFTSRTADVPPQLRLGAYVRLSISLQASGADIVANNPLDEPEPDAPPVATAWDPGLAAVRAIVRDLGGEITTHDNDRHGVTLDVYLPLAMWGDESAAPACCEIPEGHERVLLVDDDPAVAEMWESYLEQLGYRVTAITSSVDALVEFTSHPNDYDAVITDQIMPGLTGDELARQVIHDRPGLPVIVISGYSDAITANDCAELGICEFIAKPFSIREMSGALRRALDGPSDPLHHDQAAA